MKKRTDRLLLAGFLLSLELYLALLLAFLFLGGNNSPAPWPVLLSRQLHLWLVLGGHAVPFFCLQLLCCRRTGGRWVAVLPLALVAGAVLCFAWGYFTATGWDTLGWGILLAGSIAPAAGCVLGWAVWGLERLFRRGGPRP